MGLRSVFAATVLCALAGAASAQVGSKPGPDGAASAPAAGVKNAPFSAVVVTQYDRALDNSGHIHRETHGRIFRDSQGRMRTESDMPSAQPSAEKYERITINDPVQQLIINLNPHSHVATVYHFGEVGPIAPVTAKAPTPQPEGMSPSPKSTVQVGATPPSHMGTGAITGAPQPGRSSGTRTSKMGATISTSPVDTKTVSLGTRNIEGVTVVGTRTTRTLDADLMGTDKPVVSVSETWFSPDLNATILTESDDGQGGHSTMKLVNVVRAEPDAQLFRIPADYSVKESVAASTGPRH